MMDDTETLERQRLDRLRKAIETKLREKFVRWCNLTGVPLDGVEIKVNWNDSKQNDVNHLDAYDYDKY
jgi:hypothetical protein